MLAYVFHYVIILYFNRTIVVIKTYKKNVNIIQINNCIKSTKYELCVYYNLSVCLYDTNNYEFRIIYNIKLNIYYLI